MGHMKSYRVIRSERIPNPDDFYFQLDRPANESYETLIDGCNPTSVSPIYLALNTFYHTLGSDLQKEAVVSLGEAREQ